DSLDFQPAGGNDFWLVSGNSRGGIQLFQTGNTTSVSAFEASKLGIRLQQNRTGDNFLMIGDRPSSNLQVKCFSPDGRLIQQGTWQISQSTFNLNSWRFPPGVYILHIQDEKGRQKAIKWILP
ncbi:MAG: T9SS type A sorting domain-containing protein, partial [Bacteroidota bacterium]